MLNEARARADEAVQHWSRQRFHLQHLNQLWPHLDIDLYAGDGLAGWRRLCESRPALQASLLLRVQLCASISSIPVAAVRWRRPLSPTTLGQCSAPPKDSLASSIDSGCRGRLPMRYQPELEPRWSAATLPTPAAIDRRCPRLRERLHGALRRRRSPPPGQACRWRRGPCPYRSRRRVDDRSGHQQPAQMAAGITPGFREQ